MTLQAKLVSAFAVAILLLTGACEPEPEPEPNKILALSPGEDCPVDTDTERYDCHYAAEKYNFIHGHEANIILNTLAGRKPDTYTITDSVDRNRLWFAVDGAEIYEKGILKFENAIVTDHHTWIEYKFAGGADTSIVVFKDSEHWPADAENPVSDLYPIIEDLREDINLDPPHPLSNCPTDTDFSDYTCTYYENFTSSTDICPVDSGNSIFICTYTLDVIAGIDDPCPDSTAKSTYNCTDVADERPTVITELYNEDLQYSHDAEVCPDDTRTAVYDCKYINRIYDDGRPKKVVPLFYEQPDNRCPINTSSEQYLCKYAHHTFGFMHGDTADYVLDGIRNDGELSYSKQGQYWRVIPTVKLYVGEFRYRDENGDWINTTPLPGSYDIMQQNQAVIRSDVRIIDNGTWVEVLHKNEEIVIYKDSQYWPDGAVSPKSTSIMEDNRELVPKALFLGDISTPRDICPMDTNLIDYVCIYASSSFSSYHGSTIDSMMADETSFKRTYLKLTGDLENPYSVILKGQSAVVAAGVGEDLIFSYPYKFGGQDGYVIINNKWVEFVSSTEERYLFFITENYWEYEPTSEDSEQILPLFDGEVCPETYVCKYASKSFSLYHGSVATTMGVRVSGEIEFLAKLSDENIDWRLRRFWLELDLGVSGTTHVIRSKWVEFTTPDGDEIIIFKDKKYWPREDSSLSLVEVTLLDGSIRYSIGNGASPKKEVVLTLFYSDDDTAEDVCPIDTSDITYICKYADRKFSLTHGATLIDGSQVFKCAFSPKPPHSYSCIYSHYSSTYGTSTLISGTDGGGIASLDTSYILYKYAVHTGGGSSRFIDGYQEKFTVLDHGLWLEVIIPENALYIYGVNIESRASRLVLYKNPLWWPYL